MNIREAFISALEEEEPDKFLEYIEKHHSKNDTFDATEVLQTFSKKQHERLWDDLKMLCNNAILKATPGVDDEMEEQQDNEKMSSLRKCLQGVTTVGLCAISLDKPYVPSALLETAILLHGIMMNVPDETQKLQNSIAQLCETWFVNGLEGKEELVTNTIPFLIIRCLAKGTAADLKRVWALRQSLLLLDLEDDSAESLKQLFQQCMMHPSFLRVEDGRRFLSFLFGLHPEFSKDLHKTIKNQIPNCSIGVLSFYGEIYFRAWRVASGAYLQVLEKDCFQDLMYAAVHAQRTGVQSMSSRLRKVLAYVHQQKKQQGVDEMLVRLYQPILWRAFKVANPMVRANASALLIDAFPLQNPDATNEEADDLLQKQFDILQGLIEDPSPVVRATGVHGICRIAGIFWELIPVHTVKALLNKLVTEVAFDASSSTVRIAVFQGLKFLLENHLSHPLLKTQLCCLRDLIHDISEKVRSAFMDLLLLVKGIKAIKFWTIVPLEHLLACLEVETSAPVLRKLVKLLMNSFHPLNKEADIQITRSAALWEANPAAARKFYQYAHLHAAVPSTGKFILMLCRCVVQWARNIAPDSTFESLLIEDTMTPTILDSTENKENETIDEVGEAVLTLPDMETIDGILETIAISFLGIKDQLEKPANESIKSKLVQNFRKILPKLLTATEDARARAAIIVVSAHLPADCLPTFSKRCLSVLSTLHDGANSQNYGPMLDCLCSWGQAAKVLDMIDTCLVNSFSEKSQSKQTGSKTDKLSPLTAIEYLYWILYQPPCREAVMNCQNKLLNIANTLKSVTTLVENITTVTNKKTTQQTDAKDLYPKALRLFCHLQIHLDNKSFKASEEMISLMVWAENILLPRLDIYSSNNGSTLENGKRTRENLTDNYYTQEILEVILSCNNELLKLGMANEQFCVQATSLCKSIIQLGEVGLHFLSQLAQQMYQMTQRTLFIDVTEVGEVTDHTQAMLTDILRAISSNSNAENITQVLLSIKSPLSEVLKAYECKKQTMLTLVTEKPQIMASTMAACLAELSNKVLDFSELPSTVDLPILSSFILGILIKSKVLLRSFVDELEHCIGSGAAQERPILLSTLFLLSTIVNANVKIDNLKSCGLQIIQQIEQQQDDANNSSYMEVNMDQVKALSKKTLELLGVVC